MAKTVIPCTPSPGHLLFWRSLNPQPSAFICKQLSLQNTAYHGNRPRSLESRCHFCYCKSPYSYQSQVAERRSHRCTKKKRRMSLFLKFFIYKKVHFFSTAEPLLVFIQVKGRVMQHPIHTNYNHENAPPRTQTNYKGWKTKKPNKNHKSPLHYYYFYFLFFTKALTTQITKKKVGLGLFVCLSVVFIPQ